MRKQNTLSMKFSPLAPIPPTELAERAKSGEDKDVETGHGGQSSEKLQVAIRRDDFIKEDYFLPSTIPAHVKKAEKAFANVPTVPVLTQRAEYLNKEREKANLLAADRPITGLLATFTGHTSAVTTCLISIIDEEEYLLTGSMDCTIRIYSVVSGQCLRVLEGHSDMVSSLCMFDMVGTGVQSEEWR
jgi:hypothetical protein